VHLVGFNTQINIFMTCSFPDKINPGYEISPDHQHTNSSLVQQNNFYTILYWISKAGRVP